MAVSSANVGVIKLGLVGDLRCRWGRVSDQGRCFEGLQFECCNRETWSFYISPWFALRRKGSKISWNWTGGSFSVLKIRPARYTLSTGCSISKRSLSNTFYFPVHPLSDKRLICLTVCVVFLSKATRWSEIFESTNFSTTRIKPVFAPSHIY